MKQKMILKCALMGAVGCGLASAAVAIQNTQPMKDHPDWGYTIYGLPGDGSAKQTAYVFTNQNATLSWKAPSDVSSVRLLVIGGGGAGGGKYNTTAKDAGFGGGGGGGFTEVDAADVVSGETYAIVVGKGGAATTSKSENGGQSSFVGAGVEARADGGGYGGTLNAAGSAGANGGGGGGSGSTSYAGGGAMGNGAGFAGGKNGGDGTKTSSYKYRAAGGGGGAGGIGTTPSSTIGGAGGAGKMSDITGSEVYYAGGGGGGGYCNSGGLGGEGGGGKGGHGEPSPDIDALHYGTAGVDGLGGGGGGSAVYNKKFSGGRGGSGVVIVRCNESVEDPNPHPEGHDPMEISWTGKGADANWSTRENWSTGSDDQLYYFDTAVFPASCTAAVTMDKTTDVEYPAAALLSIGANANVTLGGATANCFAGNKAMALMGDGATLTVTGAGNSVVIQNKGCYTFGANATVKATDGAKLDLPRMDDCVSLDLNNVKNLKFIADGTGSWLDFRAGDAQQADVRFEAVNGGKATPQGRLSGADSTMTVVAANGGSFDASYFNTDGALVRLTAAGEGSTLAIGAFDDVGEGSTICITNAYMSFYASYQSGYKTQFGVSGATTIELVGANPRIEKVYHDGPAVFGDKLTVKLHPEASWSAGPRIFGTRSGDPAWTVSAGVHYEIDCSQLAPKQTLTFRLYELKGTKGDSVAAPADGNVTLTGTNADRFDVSFALSADGKNLDCTLKPKKMGLIFSIR